MFLELQMHKRGSFVNARGEHQDKRQKYTVNILTACLRQWLTPHAARERLQPQALDGAGAVAHQAVILARAPCHTLADLPGLALEIDSHPVLLQVHPQAIASWEAEAGGSVDNLLGSRHCVAGPGYSITNQHQPSLLYVNMLRSRTQQQVIKSILRQAQALSWFLAQQDKIVPVLSTGITLIGLALKSRFGQLQI